MLYKKYMDNSKLIAMLLVMILLISVVVIADEAESFFSEETTKTEGTQEEGRSFFGEEEEEGWKDENEWEATGGWITEGTQEEGQSFFGKAESSDWGTQAEKEWEEKIKKARSEEEASFRKEGWMTDEESRRQSREQGFDVSEIQEGEQYTDEELEQMGWEEEKAPTTSPGRKKPGIKSKPLTFLSEFLAAYDQYRGFSRFSSLFLTDEVWEKHREKVNQAFCDTIILGGTQCWTSRICDTQLYSLVPRGTFAGRTPSGERQATASIQGEKSLPIQAVDEFGNPTMRYLYKITYSISNPYESQELQYNIQFRTEDDYKINWFKDYQSTPASRTEASPLMKYGKNDYSTVCLIFHPSLIDYRSNWHGRRIRELCSPIAQYVGTATKPYPTASNSTDETTTPDAPEGLPEIEEKDYHAGF